VGVVAVIPARGGSKGIPNKNVVDLCGKPLLAWSIEQAKGASEIDSVWVSSDSAEILALAKSYGAHPIERPADLSGDTASSESAWLHALEAIERQGIKVDLMAGLQATSPLRESADLDRAIRQFRSEGLDSLLSCCEVEDFFMWKREPNGTAAAVNYDPKNRKRRQNIEKRYLENGSFYVFKPDLLRRENNRLGGKTGLFVMERHKMYQIDTPADLKLCAAVMTGYGYVRSEAVSPMKGGTT
jgi:CMP-N,N'-diacetyllegionaminic acid synthase